jgi:putative MATE family efflux protein
VALFDATDRRLLRLAGPAFLTLSAEPLYVLADTAIVGHISTSALGGLAIAGTILSTLSWLIGFLATGVTTQVGQRRGAGDEEGARNAVAQGLFVALALGIVAALVAGGPTRTLARLIGGKGAVLDAATTYLRISSLGLPAIALVLLALGWYRGTENLRIPVRVVIAANVANVLLEMLFVWVFKWGIAGSAWATVIVQWLSALAYFGFLRGVFTWQAPRRSDLRSLMKIGGAMLVRTSMMVSTLMASTWLASRDGDTSLGAHQIGVQTYFFFALMIDALAIAAQTIFAGQVGRSNGQLWVVTRRLVRLGLIAGIALGTVLVVASPWLGHVFSGDADVVARSRGVLLWCALMQISGAIVFVLDGVLMGADLFARLAIGAIVSALAFWLFALLHAKGPSALSGLAGVWLALNAWMLVRMLGNGWIAWRNLRLK